MLSNTHFSDGVLWAGLGPQPDLPSRLARWADALGVDVSDRPTVEARAQAVADAIGQRKLLLVIDDAWGLEAAEHLRCGGPNCAHLLTSRDQHLAFAFAGRSERVEELAPADALELLRRLAPKAVAVDEEQAKGLLAAVGYLPLAVELLGGYLAERASAHFAQASRSALAELTDPARRLALATRRLGDGSGQPVSLQETIALSIDGLAEESPAAVDVFYSLGAFAPKPANFDLAAAQAVAECDADALALLIERNLLEQDADESLALHQTLADVARTRTPAEVIIRHREHYLGRVKADRENWEMIKLVYPQIQWAWEQTSPVDPATFRFVGTLSTYQTRRGLWTDRQNWLKVAVSAAETTEDVKNQARMLHEFGYFYSNLGAQEKALRYYEEALPLRTQMEDWIGAASTLNGIGMVYDELGKKKEALEYYAGSLLLSRQMEDRRGESATLNNIGSSYNDLGQNFEALRCFLEALPIFRHLEDRGGEATTLNNIGGVFDVLGKKGDALQYFSEALPLFRQVGDRRGEAMTLNNIGAIYDTFGNKDEALSCYAEALTLFHQIGDRGGEAMTLGNIGVVYDDLGESEKSLKYYKDALPLFRLAEDHSGEAAMLNNIVFIHFSQGNVSAMADTLTEIIDVLQRTGEVAEEAAIRFNLASVLQVLGRIPEAITQLEESIALLVRYHLPLDISGQTLVEHQALLTKLRASQ